MTAADNAPPRSQAPSAWVAHFLAAVAPGGEVLDIACGGGRHLRLALDRGYRVVGVDRDLSGVGDLSDRPGVELIAADLEAGRPPPWGARRFQGVVVCRYLWRPLMPAIAAAVADDGVLIYETFARGHELVAPRPSNPDFLLKANELAAFSLASGLTIMAFEQGGIRVPSRQCIQRLAAVGPAHPWALKPFLAELRLPT